MTGVKTISAIHISVRGVVQGVGFRPFVYQLATRHNLKGWVCNTSEAVKIELEGDEAQIQQFLTELREKAPPLSHIEDITVKRQSPANYEKFEITHSIAEEGKYQLVSSDIATCAPCLKEVLDPSDRRYRYPFTNCTNCGPRFTIIKDIPYDRPNTTMHIFRMCPECQKEYDNPLDRRFHAQPNACPKCGPQLELLDAGGNHVACTDAIGTTARLLREGKIVAVKGLGGFLLACDATSEAAVNLLRRRKKRPSKPFAVMLSSLDEVGKHCHVSEDEERLLTSPASPIVLLWQKPDSTVTPAVAPNIKYLGVMLPYTPMHHLLLEETGLPLVMTSGNLSEEPIARDNDEALHRLKGIADFFLMHNRDIYSRYDDSVAMVERGAPQLLRRARGYAPYPVHLTFDARQILGCGAEEKNTFCLTRDRYAFVSQHIGDMENIETLEHFKSTIALYKALFRIEPQILAHDMHPEYLTTKYARELASDSDNIKLIPVQHHHAHIASCMADNAIEAPVIGVTFDGTGYGTDGNIWGGEFLVADYSNFTRMAHFEYLPLAGGVLAIKKPYRIAIGYLLALFGGLAKELPLLKQVAPLEIDVIRQQIDKKLNAPLTSSCGRLFDAVSALIGVRGSINYEAQAAIELEMLAYNAPDETGCYPFTVVEQNGMNQIKVGELFSGIIHDLHNNIDKATISARFHNTAAQIADHVCCEIADKMGINRIALSGGVFQNRLLLRKTVALLETKGFNVLTHRQVPCNDGGVSLGQVAVASYALNNQIL